MSLRFLIANGGKKWTPLDLGSKLTLWQDAQDSSTFTTDAILRYWADKSGNGHTGSANKLKMLIDGTINGFPAVRFTEGLPINYAAFSAMTTQGTIFAVCQVHTDDDIHYRCEFMAHPVPVFSENGIYAKTVDLQYDGSSERDYSRANITPDIPLLVEMIFAPTVSNSSVKINGVSSTPTFTNGVTWNMPVMTLSMQSNWTGTTHRIGELIICNEALNAGEQTLLRNYLNPKWSLP